MKILKEREADFGVQIKEFVSQYDKKMLTDFFYYWTEPNKSQTKMKFEMEKTWDITRRLRTWEKNNKNWNNGRTYQQLPVNGSKAGTSDARVEALKNW